MELNTYKNVSRPPQFDAKGIQVLDPKDKRGTKSLYITIVQKKALELYMPVARGLALDVGCGYGRLSAALAEKGWQVVGIDPSLELIQYAANQYPSCYYCVGALPNLPIKMESAHLLVLQNVLRPLLKLNSLSAISGCGKYVSEGGYILVVENIRPAHPDYVNEAWILRTFQKESCQLILRVPIRAGRWWLLYLIRYGIIPRKWLPAIADYELRLRSKKSGRDKWRYTNVLFLFKKKNRGSF